MPGCERGLTKECHREPFGMALIYSSIKPSSFHFFGLTNVKVCHDTSIILDVHITRDIPKIIYIVTPSYDDIGRMGRLV